jgi:F-type H+-transporting ATPase subunit gamma
LKEVREISAESKTFTAQYIFEPDPARALNFLLPRLVEIDIYYAILESLASEHSARMVAMKNATDNAGNLITDLTLAYNQARQSAITREIAEISSGAMSAM